MKDIFTSFVGQQRVATSTLIVRVVRLWNSFHASDLIDLSHYQQKLMRLIQFLKDYLLPLTHTMHTLFISSVHASALAVFCNLFLLFFLPACPSI